MEFHVSTDSQRVDNFAIYVNVPGCGGYKITHLVPAAITGNSFAFTGTFNASGTSASPTSASGTAGLDDFYINNCGYVSGGPYIWNANWIDSAQATAQDAVEPDSTEAADILTPFMANLVP